MMSSRPGSQRGDICAICRDAFTDPRELSCTHAFCLRCLTSLIDYARQDYGTTFKCPLCKREFPILIEHTSEDIANDFRRNIQRRKINDSGRHRVVSTHERNNAPIQRNRPSSKLPHLNRGGITDFPKSFRELDNFHLPSINANRAQAPVTVRNFTPPTLREDSFLLPNTPESGNPDDEFFFPSTPDSGNSTDQFLFPVTPDLFETDNIPLLPDITNHFQPYNFKTRNRNTHNRTTKQLNLFEPGGIINHTKTRHQNIFELVGDYIVHDPTPMQVPRDSTPIQVPRIQSPRRVKNSNRNTRLNPITSLQRPSNEAVMSQTCHNTWNNGAVMSQACHNTWNNGAVMSQTFHHTWNNQAVMSQTCHNTWNNQAVMSQTCHNTWNIQAVMSQTCQNTWNYQAVMSQTCHNTWNNQAVISQTCHNT